MNSVLGFDDSKRDEALVDVEQWLTCDYSDINKIWNEAKLKTELLIYLIWRLIKVKAYWLPFDARQKRGYFAVIPSDSWPKTQ